MSEAEIQVSVVIPVYNALALAQECVRSIFESGSALAFEVLVVDNGSGPEVGEWLRREEEGQTKLRHLRDERALGFAVAVNRGVAASTGAVVIVLNSDTLVSRGWMEGLWDALMTDPTLGAVTPCTNHAGEPAQMDLSTIERTPAEAWAIRAGKSRTPEVLYLAQRITFFAVALRRDVWDAMQGLAECYPVGNFEDDDLCLRLRVAGYRLGVAQHVFVFHHNNATFEANRIDHARQMAENAAIFAGRARVLSEAAGGIVRRWPKRAAAEVSVVIHPQERGLLERTLRSLENQTVQGFEILAPGHGQGPSRAWVAHVMEGDVLYPFHIEALLDALERNGGESICADAWSAARNELWAHPDAARDGGRAPRMLAGWVHHASLEPERLWERSVPLHWPRLTWELSQEPALPAARAEKRSLVGLAREVYRRRVKLETRLRVDAAVRKALGLKAATEDGDGQLRAATAELEAILRSGSEVNKFAAPGGLPPVVQFNAVTWHSATQRQHHFARGLARLGHPVIWVETDLRSARNCWTGRRVPEVAPGVHLVRLPGATREIYHMPWSEAAVEAMAAAMRLTASAYGFREAIALVNYPRWQPLVSRLKEREGWKVVYDCLDDQLAMAQLYQTEVAKYEEQLVLEADDLFTSSVVLRDRLPRSATLLQNGADFTLFSSSQAGGYLKHLPRPVIGFFGALADWLDMELIRAAAVRFPEYSFVYIGPQVFSSAATEARWRASTDLPNVTLVPQLEPGTLAAYLAEFDVCTMPFLDVPVTRTMNAVKLYEYLAAGKPVVSRSLPEVRHLVAEAGELIGLYTTPEEFFAGLQSALATDTPARAEQRRNFARQHDWRERVDVLSERLRAF